MEHTHPVPAIAEVVEVDRASLEEFVNVVGESCAGSPEPAELSGKFLSELRAADAIVLAVPCPGAESDPVKWYQMAESILVSHDLLALEQQVCKQGTSGADAELDESKLRKSLSNSKDPTVKRDAEDLLRNVLAPGLSSLRKRLRAGVPAREARGGLERLSGSENFLALDNRFEDLARGWLNALTTWRPLLVVADVPESDAGFSLDANGASSPVGNSSSIALKSYLEKHGVPCVTLCVALEGESAGLKDEPDFLKEYLESYGLVDANSADKTESDQLRAWSSQCPELVTYFPRLLNQMIYYTAGEKEARAWMCPRVRKDRSPLPFSLIVSKVASTPPAKNGKANKDSSASSPNEDGVPAFLASRAIHTSFESRLKNVLLWKFSDLEVIGISDSGPGAKERAKADGKMKKCPSQHLLEDGDVVEFDLK
eukprot:CAMPEP_0169176620 /NCGR_PEP_ID=MMETSP1015-20121227/65966_1 /TAXON_ID=342587 /ORGANISM="Karlodinium micrum, Strain CCMP2283" /LENGTH=426 /DNA_ID=CAMNT_0009251137 /DNA_START=276 /DNA_END=1556 /DNA_ORIENTATION=-